MTHLKDKSGCSTHSRKLNPRTLNSPRQRNRRIRWMACLPKGTCHLISPLFHLTCLKVHYLYIPGYQILITMNLVPSILWEQHWPTLYTQYISTVTLSGPADYLSNCTYLLTFYFQQELLLGYYTFLCLFNPLKPELNPICYLLALLAHHFLHVSRIRVKSLTIRLLMSFIYIWSTYSWCF